MDKIRCPVCDRAVPVNLDGTPKRHDAAPDHEPCFRFQTTDCCYCGECCSEPCQGDAYNLVPILFSDPMVRAILEDRKSVTRRESERWMRLMVGDRLWVRETWCPSFATDDDSVNGCCYRATNNGPDPLRWRSSIHMPYPAHRLLLEVTEPPRREPVREITDEEAAREGAYQWPHDPDRYPRWTMDLPPATGWTSCDDSPRLAFRAAWNHLHPGTWDTSCPVRIAFRRVR